MKRAEIKGAGDEDSLAPYSAINESGFYCEM